MALAIEDCGLIGDTHTAALVLRRLDRLALPARFDSGACVAALLGRLAGESGTDVVSLIRLVEALRYPSSESTTPRWWR